jgi:hypothetical protein
MRLLVGQLKPLVTTKACQTETGPFTNLFEEHFGCMRAAISPLNTSESCQSLRCVLDMPARLYSCTWAPWAYQDRNRNFKKMCASLTLPQNTATSSFEFSRFRLFARLPPPHFAHVYVSVFCCFILKKITNLVGRCGDRDRSRRANPPRNPDRPSRRRHV